MYCTVTCWSLYPPHQFQSWIHRSLFTSAPPLRCYGYYHPGPPKIGFCGLLCVSSHKLATMVPFHVVWPQLTMSCILVLQVTSCLRNLSEPAKHAKLFAELGVVQSVMGILKHLGQYKDLVLNAARILAKLSLHHECRACIHAR